MGDPKIPRYTDILWPTLKALENSGGSASIEELYPQVAAILKIPDDVLEIPHGRGSRSEVEYRSAWARTHLKYISAVDNSARGVWSLTETGRKLSSEKEVQKLVEEFRSGRRKKRKSLGRKGTEKDIVEDEELEEEEIEDSWTDQLLTLVRQMSPAGFERLCQRILRESGFTRVEVTGKSGDGGIDGSGVLRLNLLSFHVRFQCKKWEGSVSASDIRDFRGAMIGRADKGLFITTGRFTPGAEQEASRDGALPLDLIDGAELCRLLKRLGLGVRTEQIENVTPIPEFFQSI